MTAIPGDARSAGDVPRSDPPSNSGSAKVRREPKRVVVRLMDGARVEGFIHLPPSSRPLDLLNHRDEGFIAITDVRLSEHGHAVQELPFLAVSKGQIARMYEAKES